jgi:hypothetical protein
MEGVGVIRIDDQNLPIDALGLDELSGGVLLRGEFETLPHDFGRRRLLFEDDLLRPTLAQTHIAAPRKASSASKVKN